MRKIALISEHASPLAAAGGIDSGGQNVYVARLARQLGHMGYQVDVYTRRDASHLPIVVEWQPSVRVVHVPAGPASYIPKEAMLPYMEDFARFMIDFSHEECIDYDLAHANFFMSGMAALRFKKETGTPFVTTFHALGKVRRLCQGQADGFPDERFAIEEKLMRESARVIAECEQDRIDMKTLYGADERSIDIVPCGFDAEEFWPVRSGARERLQLRTDEFIVLQLGRIVPRKGIDNVIRAIGEMRRKHSIAARLLVVGGNSREPDPAATPELSRLASIARAEGVEDRVTFVGQRSRQELRFFYSAADVFVTTPWYEPFGITPVEAMACSTPVIGSSVGGIKSTVVDGQTGYLVPPNDPGALAERLAWLYHRPQTALRLGWSGLRRAYRHFTWRKVASQVATVYESAMESTPLYGAAARAGNAVQIATSA